MLFIVYNYITYKSYYTYIHIRALTCGEVWDVAVDTHTPTVDTLKVDTAETVLEGSTGVIVLAGVVLVVERERKKIYKKESTLDEVHYRRECLW